MSKSPKVPSDGLILAAVDRACRHSPRPPLGATRWEVLEHLGVAKRTRAARVVRERLEALADAGVLERGKAHSNLLWRLSGRGERRVRAVDAFGELPESPQHRRWRDAREAAPGHLERGLAALGGAIGEASKLREAKRPVGSDAWLLAGLRLCSACRLLAKATHCLYEWPEPDDAQVDVDDRDAEPASLLASEEELRSVCRMRRDRRSRDWYE
jgi:hypothetical protein